MKRMMIMALVVLASATFGTASAAKKDKKNKKAEVKKAVVLATSSDTLSYVAGKGVTNGLLPYLKQNFGVDSANIADFLRGFEEMNKLANDPKMKAYAAGIQISDQLNNRMIKSMKERFSETPDSIINEVLYQGFMDAVKGYPTLFKQEEAERRFREMSEKNEQAKSEKLYGANREAGKAFLAENAKKEGVVTLPSGLQYKVLTKGEGAVPKMTDKVEVNYEGRLVDGTVFDSSSKHGSNPVSFRADQVIKGWTEALTMMPVGSKWQLFIPYQLAYGERNMGNIKPFSALIFDVELVGIEGQTNNTVEEKKEEKESVAAAKITPAKKKAKAKK